MRIQKVIGVSGSVKKSSGSGPWYVWLWLVCVFQEQADS